MKLALHVMVTGNIRQVYFKNLNKRNYKTRMFPAELHTIGLMSKRMNSLYCKFKMKEKEYHFYQADFGVSKPAGSSYK